MQSLSHELALHFAACATAAVDEVVRRGVVDRERVAVGGHSYGASMAANLLAHAGHLFACGIAQSGAYNRSLTPFGFQVCACMQVLHVIRLLLAQSAVHGGAT